MKRGDVILCTFPHSSTAPAKVRPALVVQSDYYNDRIANLLVAGITGNLLNSSDPAHFAIDLSTPEGRQSIWPSFRHETWIERSANCPIRQ